MARLKVLNRIYLSLVTQKGFLVTMRKNMFVHNSSLSTVLETHSASNECISSILRKDLHFDIEMPVRITAKMGVAKTVTAIVVISKQ